MAESETMTMKAERKSDPRYVTREEFEEWTECVASGMKILRDDITALEPPTPTQDRLAELVEELKGIVKEWRGDYPTQDMTDSLKLSKLQRKIDTLITKCKDAPNETGIQLAPSYHKRVEKVVAENPQVMDCAKCIMVLVSKLVPYYPEVLAEGQYGGSESGSDIDDEEELTPEQVVEYASRYAGINESACGSTPGSDGTIK